MSRDFYLKKYRTTGSDRRTKNKDRRTDIPSESIEKDPLVIDLQEQLLPKPPARKPRRNQKQKKGTQRISQSQLPIEDIKVEPRNTPSPEKSKNKTKKMSERVNESVGAPVSNRLLKRVLKVISQTKRAKNDNAPATSSRTEEIKSSILASNATQVSANDLMLVLKDAEKTLKDLKENRNYLKNPCFKNSTTTNSKKSDRPLNQQETSTQTSPPANKNNSERPTLKDNKTRQIRNEPFRTERSYSRNVNTYQHPRSLREQSNNTIVHSQRINTDQAFETTPRNYKPFNYSDSPNVQLNNSFFQPPNNGYQAICNPQLYSNPPNSQPEQFTEIYTRDYRNQTINSHQQHTNIQPPMPQSSNLNIQQIIPQSSNSNLQPSASLQLQHIPQKVAHEAMNKNNIPTLYQSNHFQDVTNLPTSNPQAYNSQIYSPQTFNPPPYNSQPYSHQAFNPQTFNSKPYNPQGFIPQQYNPQQYNMQTFNQQ